MAGRKPPKPRFLAGQFVTYRCAEDAVVDNILDSGLGFNIYAIFYVVMATSRRLRVFPRFWGFPLSAVVLLYKTLIEVAI